jgi:glycosyltransferase involved in cell wall biosynthesis
MNRIYGLRGDTWNRSIHSYRFSNHFLYLKRIIDLVEPDLIHAHHAHSRPIWSWLACEGNIPIITTLHSFHALLGASSKKRKSKEELFRKSFAISSRLIAVSDFVREQAIELGAEPEDVVVIPNGIDIDRFYPDQIDRAREKLGLNKKLKYILFVGSLSGRKSVDMLIRAFAQVCHAGMKARLLIVGDGDEKRRLQDLITSLGLSSSVIFLGTKNQDELPALYNASNLFVSVPSSEAQGIVFLEAMSCAKPCIGSRVGGIPVMVKDGETGFLVDYGDIEALADRIERLLQSQDLADRMGHMARNSVVQSFSWKSLTKRTYKLYAEVVKHTVK